MASLCLQVCAGTVRHWIAPSVATHSHSHPSTHLLLSQVLTWSLLHLALVVVVVLVCHLGELLQQVQEVPVLDP